MASLSLSRRVPPNLFCVLIGVCMVALWATPLQAQNVLRWIPNLADNQTVSIKVEADQIATWDDPDTQIYLLHGNVLVSQGTTEVRTAKGVVWIDTNTKRQKGVTRLLLYLEGQVELSASNQLRKLVDRAVVALQTQANITFRPGSKPLIKKAFPQYDVYRRGLQEVFPGKQANAAIPQKPPTTNARITAPPIAESSPANSKLAPTGVEPQHLSLPPAPASPIPTPATSKPKTVARANPIRLTGGIALQDPNAQPLPTAPPQPQGLLPTPNLQPGGPPVVGRQILIRPRSSFQDITAVYKPLPNGETATIVTTGIILTVTNADGAGGILDIEADRLVSWSRGGDPAQFLRSGSAVGGSNSWEFYLSGNVEIRTISKGESRTLRANEVYYDINRSVAIATHADLQIDDPRLLNPIHFKSDEILQLNANVFRAVNAEVSASALPADPGLSIVVKDAELETRQVIRKTIFGRPVIDRKTGQPIAETQRYFKGKNAAIYLEDIPVFWVPYLQGDAEDPLGPLENVGLSYNRIFGMQIYTTWDVYDLFGVSKIPDTDWRLNLDVLTDRGPVIGTDFRYRGVDLFGIPNRYQGVVRAFGMYDGGDDIIGGGRGTSIRIDDSTVVPVEHPDARGRLYSRLNVQDLPNGFTIQKQISLQSDKNYLEQYFNPEFMSGENQETTLYIKQQQNNWAWTGLVRPRVRRWVTETETFPQVDGHLIGLKFFDLATYNARASVGYYELEPTDEPAFAYLATDVTDTNTGRFDLMQELSIPVPLGPFKLAPYGIIDLAYYNQNQFGESQGRIYGGGGLRASMPLSRLYQDVYSEMFNLNSIYHKIVFSGNYYIAGSNVSYRDLPQLDRLNDYTSDQALRDIQPFYQVNDPALANNLLTGQLFDPQLYAVRQLILDRIDTLDDIQVVQLGVRQRWQTKRGYPGRQHIVDWMTLDLTGSVFPAADRDNFGEAFAFLKYNWTWNVGDRTSLVSTGWIDPVEDGARVFTLGGNLNRPNRTNFYLGYRQIDPIGSKSVIGSVGYIFSQKYSMTTSVAYDFGIENQVTSLVLTRNGKDLRVSAGIAYNSIVNSVGVVFEIMPNLLPVGGVRSPATAGMFVDGLQNGR